MSDRMRGLLLRQGALLKMQTEDALRLCVREANEFFGNHYGMLMTVDQENNERINEIIQQIDGTGILTDGKVRIIEIGEGMEIIVNDPNHGNGTLLISVSLQISKNAILEITNGMFRFSSSNEVNDPMDG